jgi:hypothetical protein
MKGFNHMIKIDEVIESLLKLDAYRKYFTGLPYRKGVVDNVLKLICDKYLNMYNNILEPESLSLAIEEAVKSYTRDKKTVITVAKKLIDYLRSEHSFYVDIAWPPIDISNTFERLMYIAKELQMSDKTIEDLSDELWISTRTLEDDLSRLRGYHDPIQVCGKPFLINEMVRDGGRIKFTSTVHPLFLTLNITQVIVTLKGLKHMCKDPILGNYALISAKSIWQQLSDYAKKRILYVSEHLLPDDRDWYLSLDEPLDNYFYTEYECSHTEGAGVLCDCIKNRKTCYLEYLTNSGERIFLERCSVISLCSDGKCVKALVNNEEIVIELKRVLRSAYTREELI